jgi:hypothetical protein
MEASPTVERLAREMYRSFAGQLDAHQILELATALLGEVAEHVHAAHRTGTGDAVTSGAAAPYR